MTLKDLYRYPCINASHLISSYIIWKLIPISKIFLNIFMSHCIEECLVLILRRIKFIYFICTFVNPFMKNMMMMMLKFLKNRRNRDSSWGLKNFWKMTYLTYKNEQFGKVSSNIWIFKILTAIFFFSTFTRIWPEIIYICPIR